MRCSVQCIKNTMRYIDICNLSDQVGILYRNGWVLWDWVFGWLGLDSGGVFFFLDLFRVDKTNILQFTVTGFNSIRTVYP